MTYNGEKVRLSKRLIAEYIKQMGYEYYTDDVYDYYKWHVSKGRKFTSVEEIVDSLHEKKQLKKRNRELRKAEKRERREREHREFLKEAYHIYTDGSCDNVRTKVGGSAYVILKDGVIVKKKSKGFYPTTNNRMEMLAIISALNSLPKGSSAIVYTDSKYSIGAFDGRTGPKNQDLIQLFRKTIKPLKAVAYKWVKGHSGVEYNEMADNLAFSAYKEMSEKLGFPISRYMLKTH